MLWLKGQKQATPAGEVLIEIEKLVDRKLMGVRVALDPSAHHGWDQFEALYLDVQALGEVADAW
jgi:hypothetical protein